MLFRGFGVFPDTGILFKYFLFSFSHFLPSFSDARPPNADLIFNAEIPFLSAFNALQIKSNQVIMTFFLLCSNATLAFDTGRRAHLHVWLSFA